MHFASEVGVGTAGGRTPPHTDFPEGQCSDSLEDPVQVPMNPVLPDPRRLMNGCSTVVSKDRLAMCVGKKWGGSG